MKYELEPVNIPTYDPNNPEHLLITTTNGNYLKANFNDTQYTNFYIEAGNYGGDAYISLNISGTSAKRRTISLHNGNNTHPAALQDNEVANVFFQLNSSYWTIDRICHLDRVGNPSLRISGGGSHNILNRLHLRNVQYGIAIYPFCNYNTIQNCYINGAELINGSIYADAHGVAMINNAVQDTVSAGNKIIFNEIRNMTDGVQLVKSASIASGNPSYPGTIICGNKIWIDENVYTDGDWVNEGYSNDINSEYCTVENGLDIKATSNDQNNPVIVENNIFWGYRRADETLPTNNTPKGNVFTIKNKAHNLIIRNNIIFDSTRVASIVGMQGTNAEVSDNIFFDIGKHCPPTAAYPEGETPFSLYISRGADDVANTGVEYKNNSFIDIHKNQTTGLGNTIVFGVNIENDFFDKNIFINTTPIGNGSNLHEKSDNWYYNHTGQTLGGTETIKPTSAEAQMLDYTFEYESFTAAPKTKTLQGIISSQNSQHFGIEGSRINAAETKVLQVENEGTWVARKDGSVDFAPERGFTQSPTPIKYRVKDTSGTLSNFATITVNYN